jgi:hypothetical protein
MAFMGNSEAGAVWSAKEELGIIVDFIAKM